jgi:prepilin-type N-terminal cleavage/methylation domain-containing protein
MKARPTFARDGQAGVTLIELLIAVTLLGLLSVGIVISLRVALNAMNKADSKLILNRRETGTERILEQEIAGLIPIAADCVANGESPTGHITFFQGEAQSMRFVSTYSLAEASRGLPTILELQVIPGENGRGVRLVVNEHVYSGPLAAGAYCAGIASDPETGGSAPQFVPIQVGAGSFVLADKLAYCRFSFRDVLPPPELSRWVAHWVKPTLPTAIRIETAPLDPDFSKLQPVSLTVPVHVTRHPLESYEN